MARSKVPRDPLALLQAVEPERRRIYQMTRKILDDLDRAAPWTQLYYPPESKEAFLAMERALLEVVDGIPSIVEEVIGELHRDGDEAMRQNLEEAEFFFGGIHSMVENDLYRLRAQLEPVKDGVYVSPQERNFISEISADLKGKYSSALMGATASIIGEGRWSGVDIEPILFSEKIQEFERNERLVDTLVDLIAAIERLPREIGYADIVDRWRHGQRVDQYVLTDFATFRGQLGRLLRSDNRRALYSGDYHQIQIREQRLSVRINELESLHRATWTAPSQAEGMVASELYDELVRLAIEIAAVLDIELLEALVGAKLVKDLRTLITIESERAKQRPNGDDELGETSTMRTSLPPEARMLPALLHDEDLKSFLVLLLGSVRKRASLSQRVAAELEERVPAEQADEQLRPLELVSDQPEEELEEIPEAEPEPEEEEEEKPKPRRGPSLSPEEELAALERVHDLLVELQSSANPHWNGVRMLRRLLDKHSRIPPSMVQSAHPFLQHLLNTLVPELDVVTSFEAVSDEARHLLVKNCLDLCSLQLTPDQMDTEVPEKLHRVLHVLEGMAAETASEIEERRAASS